jgi:hypothetical protein
MRALLGGKGSRIGFRRQAPLVTMASAAVKGSRRFSSTRDCSMTDKITT